MPCPRYSARHARHTRGPGGGPFTSEVVTSPSDRSSFTCCWSEVNTGISPSLTTAVAILSTRPVGFSKLGALRSSTDAKGAELSTATGLASESTWPSRRPRGSFSNCGPPVSLSPGGPVGGGGSNWGGVSCALAAMAERIPCAVPLIAAADPLTTAAVALPSAKPTLSRIPTVVVIPWRQWCICRLMLICQRCLAAAVWAS